MLNFFTKILFFILIVNIVDACSLREFGRGMGARPDDYFEEELTKDASLDVKQGWEDGCNIGMSGGSNIFYKMFYQSNAIDGFKAANSPSYNSAWNDAFWFCYRHDYVKHKSSIWGSVMNGYM